MVSRAVTLNWVSLGPIAMRYAFILALLVAGCSRTPAPQMENARPKAPKAAVQTDAAKVEPTGSIPQDIPSMERRRSDLLKWNLETLVGAYDKVGKKNPKWDEQARAALDLSARMFSLQIDPSVYWTDIAKPAKAAIDAGCDDPLVVFFFARSQPRVNDADNQKYKDAAKAFANSRYPVWRRAAGLAISIPGELKPGAEGDPLRKEAQTAYDRALALLPESVTTDERNELWERMWKGHLPEGH